MCNAFSTAPGPGSAGPRLAVLHFPFFASKPRNSSRCVTTTAAEHFALIPGTSGSQLLGGFYPRGLLWDP